MSLCSSADSIIACETDPAEGCLFLCESDLISALHFSHATTGAQPGASLAQEAAGVLLSLKSQFPAAAC